MASMLILASRYFNEYVTLMFINAGSECVTTWPNRQPAPVAIIQMHRRASTRAQARLKLTCKVPELQCLTTLL
jgi:hypothetical protein